MPASIDSLDIPRLRGGYLSGERRGDNRVWIARVRRGKLQAPAAGRAVTAKAG